MKEHLELLGKLYARMGKMIPLCQSKTLKDRLEHLFDDLKYTAPEAIGYWGEKVELALFSEFGETPPTEGWGKEVVDAWVMPNN